MATTREGRMRRSRTNRVVRAATAGALACLSLIGCASLPSGGLGDTSMIESFMAQRLPAGDFRAHQAIAYQAQALTEATEDASWRDAEAFYRRGQGALLGEEVAPWDPRDFGLGDRRDLMEARRLTIAAAATYRATRPAECAEMVTRFDALIEAVRDGAATVARIDRAGAAWSVAYAACRGPRIVLEHGGGPQFTERRGAVDAMVDAMRRVEAHGGAGGSGAE